MRVEARLHGMNWGSGSNIYIFQAGGLNARFNGGSGLVNRIFVESLDTVSNPYGNCSINLGSSPSTDLIVRVDRDVSGLQIRGEAFDVQTGLQIGDTCNYTITSLASSGAIQGNGILVPYPQGSPLLGNMAYLRWFNSSVPGGTPAPIAVASPATIADYEFQNSLADTSGNSQTLSGATVTYVNTPVYNPSCVPGVQQVLKVGAAMHLDGSASQPLDGGLTLTYAWSYFTGSDGVNQSPSISGGTTATPTASNMNLFGSANFQLIVTDGSASSSTCRIHNGMVMTQGSGNIIDLTGEGLSSTQQQLVGPLIMYGHNTWPWADTNHKLEGDLQTANINANYTPFWRTPMAGTISVTSGSTIITGTGTNLLAPCNGGLLPLGIDNGPKIILIYPGTDGRTHYLNGINVGCIDATHLQFNMPKGGPYPATITSPSVLPTCSPTCTGWGWQWGYAIEGSDPDIQPNSQYGNWIYAAAPGNYYDNVKMFYALYLRTGIDTYQKSFHDLADEWWEFPVMDQGYACDPAGSSCWAPVAYRSMSINGIVLRALEQGPSSPIWPGMWIADTLAAASMALLPAVPTGPDGRESGYAMSILAYCALADPDSGHRTTCKGNIQSALSTWASFRKTTSGSPASWPAVYFSNQVSATQATSVTSQGGQGSACVINGSTTVTGTGTAWSNVLHNDITNFNIWFFGGTPANLPATNAAGDAVSYGIVSVNPGAQTMVLNSAYAGTSGCTGTSGSNKGFLVGYYLGATTPDPTGGFVGWGIQPYQQGILGAAFGWAAMAMADGGFDLSAATTYRGYLHDTVMWQINNGFNPAYGGLYAGSEYIGCIPPISAGNAACNPGGYTGSRTLSLDIMRAFAMDYQNSANTTVRTGADLLMSQMFSKPGTGGPNPDGFYLSDYDYPNGTFVSGPPPTGTAPKWAGQLCGFEEACDMWPAVRIQSGGGGSRVAGPVRSVGVVRQ